MKYNLPWKKVPPSNKSFATELKREMSSNHILANEDLVPIARRVDNDDVLFQLRGKKVAIVHLTWSGVKETDSQFPHTVIYSTIKDFKDQSLIE